MTCGRVKFHIGSMLFLQTVTPPHLLGQDAQTAPRLAAPPTPEPARLANAAIHTYQGQVVDAATGAGR